MEEFQFSIPVKCLQLSGFRTMQFLKFPKLFHVMPVFFIFCVVSCSLSEVYFIMENYKDVLASAESFTPLSIEMITFCKILTFYIRRGKFYKMMNQIKDLSANSNASDLLIVKRANNFNKTVGLAYLMSGSFAALGYCFRPIVANLVNVLIFGTEYNYEMPFKALFPFDITKHPIYETSYFIFSCATYITLFMNVSKVLIK